METTNRGCAAGIWKFLAASLLWLACVPAFATGQVETYDYDAAGNIVGIHRVAASSPLAITSFSPTHGDVGTRVVVRGIGFSASPAANAVKFNGTATPTLAATTTQLLVAVPSGATTGPISVTVGATTVTSSVPFTVGALPPGPPAISGLSPLSGTLNSIITVFGTNLAPAGQTAVSINGVPATVTSPGNIQTSFKIPGSVGSGPVKVTTAYGQATSSSILQVVPATIPATSVTWNPALETNGAARSVSLGANAYAAFVFQGHVGDFLSFQLSAFTSSDNALTYAVFDPLGVQVTNGTLSPSSPVAHVPALRADGYYSVFFGAGSGSDQFSVALVSDPVLTVDAGTVNVSTTAGQSPRYVFAANAGDNIGVGIRNIAVGNTTGDSIQVFVYKPDGTQLTSVAACRVYYGGCDINLVGLPTTGMYALLFAPANGSPQETMSFDLTLTHDRVTSLPENASTAMALLAGQNGRFTFAGTAGTSMGLQVGGLATTPSGKSAVFSVLKPDGTTWKTATAAGGYGFNLVNLPVTGTYTVFVDPQYGVPATVTANLVPSASASVAVDGGSSSISTTSMPGTYAYMTFAATQGDNIGIGVRDLVVANSTYDDVVLYVYKPDGTQLGSSTDCRMYYGGCDINLANLPQSGTYTILATQANAVVAPLQTATFTINITHDLVNALSENAPTGMTLAMGRNGRFTFAGTAGTSMGLQVGGLATTPSGKSAVFSVLKPDGTTWKTATAAGGYGFNLVNLPVTGTYTVFVDPQYGVPATVTANLVPSASAAVAVDGASSTISTTSMPGTYAYMTFAATQGDNIGIGVRDLVVANSTYDDVVLYVYKPDGTQLGSSTDCRMYYGGCDINLANLPQSGTYTILATQANAVLAPSQTSTFTINITHDLVATLPTGTPGSSTLAMGQNGRLTFDGTAGASATVTISSVVTTPTGKSVALTVRKPDGSTLATASATSSYTFNLTNLPVTGTYVLFVDPVSGVAASFQAVQP